MTPRVAAPAVVLNRFRVTPVTISFMELLPLVKLTPFTVRLASVAVCKPVKFKELSLELTVKAFSAPVSPTN